MLAVQAGGNAKSTTGSIKENVGGLVSDQWAAEGKFDRRKLQFARRMVVTYADLHSLVSAGKQQRVEGDAEVEAAKVRARLIVFGF